MYQLNLKERAKQVVLMIVLAITLLFAAAPAVDSVDVTPSNAPITVASDQCGSDPGSCGSGGGGGG